MSLNFRSIFESSPDPYLVLLPDPPRFTMIAATAAYGLQTNVCPKAIVGKSVFEVFPENPRDPAANSQKTLRDSLMRVLEYKSPDSILILKYDIRKRPSDGGDFEERFWSVSNIPVLENGDVKYIINRPVDVTDFMRIQKKDSAMEQEIFLQTRQLKEANEKLQAAVRVRDDVLAIVSHDLKNPLSSIEMGTDILKESLKGQETLERIEMIRVIERSVRHMKRLIGDLLSFAKIQSGSFTIEVQKFSLRKLLLEAQQSVLHGAIKKRVHIRVDIKTRGDQIFCDHDRLLEVLSNILGNAIKFSHAGGLVWLRVHDKKGYLHFSVQDEGSGITEENMPHLFDRYWQAKETARHGAGLGLAIAKGIVLGHHGDIWAESKVGHGTTMHFTIPYDFPLDETAKVVTNTSESGVGLNLAKSG